MIASIISLYRISGYMYYTILNIDALLAARAAQGWPAISLSASSQEKRKRKVFCRIITT